MHIYLLSVMYTEKSAVGYIYAQLCMVPGQATKSSDHPITTWARYINA